MKIVYERRDSGVIAGGIFFAPGVPTEVPEEIAEALLRLPYFKVLESRERKKRKERKKVR